MNVNKSKLNCGLVRTLLLVFDPENLLFVLWQCVEEIMKDLLMKCTEQIKANTWDSVTFAQRNKSIKEINLKAFKKFLAFL